MAKAKDIIESLRDTDWGENNEAQMKAVQLLKGLALSEENISNVFMKAMSDASTVIANKILKASEEGVKKESYERAIDKGAEILEGLDEMEKPKPNSPQAKADAMLDRACDLL